MPRSARRLQLVSPSADTGGSGSRSRARETGGLPSPGDVLGGKYHLGRVLGEGGMGVVYEATHTRLQQRLAIKVLRPDVPDFEAVMARFEREARATAQLRTIHAARVIDVEVMPGGLPYIVMEYLEGADLDAELQTGGPMAVGEAVDVVLQVAAAMTDAHALGIVHRDLKPSNVFVCHVGGRRVIKVLDFGISKIEGDNEARITGSHTYFGTPCYAAPEQLLSAADADQRSDIWSLGIMLYELLTGRLPFLGSTTEVIAKVMSEPVRWPGELRPDLPRDLARVVMRALQRDRRQRFQSMAELAAALGPFGPTQTAAAVVADAQRGRGRLGEILVTEGLISEADLSRALEEQRRTGRLLGGVLLEWGLVAHADLLTALAKQQGIGPVSAAVSGMAHERMAHERMSREAITISSGTETPTKASRVRWPWVVLAVGIGLAAGVALAFTARSAGHVATPSVDAASVVRPALAVPQTVVTLPNLPPTAPAAPAPAPPETVERPAAPPLPKAAPQPPPRRPHARFEPESL